MPGPLSEKIIMSSVATAKPSDQSLGNDLSVAHTYSLVSPESFAMPNKVSCATAELHEKPIGQLHPRGVSEIASLSTLLREKDRISSWLAPAFNNSERNTRGLPIYGIKLSGNMSWSNHVRQSLLVTLKRFPAAKSMKEKTAGDAK